jgi:hypothetical protein
LLVLSMSPFLGFRNRDRCLAIFEQVRERYRFRVEWRKSLPTQTSR